MEPSLFDFQYFSLKGSPSISFQKAPLKSNIGAIIDMLSVIQYIEFSRGYLSISMNVNGL